MIARPRAVGGAGTADSSSASSGGLSVRAAACGDLLSPFFTFSASFLHPQIDGKQRREKQKFWSWIGRCKPDSVPSPFSAGDDHLSTRLLPGRIHLLSETCERAALDPVLSCTAWGLSCLLHCCWSGGLLPRLFTLTLLCRSSERRFVFCDTFHCCGLRPQPPTLARGMLPCGVRTFLTSAVLQPDARSSPADPILW